MTIYHIALRSDWPDAVAAGEHDPVPGATEPVPHISGPLNPSRTSPAR